VSTIPAKSKTYAAMAGPCDRISVFMPTFRCRRWLKGAILSVQSQTWRAIDLYVVDDCSGDVDDGVVAEFAGVNFLRSKKQSGPYAIVNALLALTESEYVGFHDADDLAHPDRFTTQIAFLRAHRADACGSWCLLEDEERDAVGFQTYPERASESFRQGNFYPILHPTTLLTRKLLKKLGGFDSSKGFGADTEFFFRACLSARIRNVQSFLYRRLVRPDSLTQSHSTGFGSAKRAAYVDRLEKAAERARSGRDSFLTDGRLLTGETVPSPSVNLLEVIHIAARNSTYRGNDENRQARRRDIRGFL
jgi:glycosyltransferase involved in cell wall biosynthesis